MLYRLHDNLDLLTDNEDDDDQDDNKYFSSSLDNSFSNFTNIRRPYQRRNIQSDFKYNNPVKIHDKQDFYIPTSSGGPGLLEVDLEFTSKTDPITTTVAVSPAIVTAQTMKIDNQSINILVPNVPALVLPDISVVELRTADGLLEGIGKNLSSLAADTARKIFAQFFITAMRAGLLTKIQTLIMARQADKELRQMEFDLDKSISRLSKQGARSSKAVQLNKLLENKMQEIKVLKAQLNNIDPLTMDLTMSFTNVSDDTTRLKVDQEIAQQLQERMIMVNGKSDPERLFKSIVKMQDKTKKMLLQFVNNIHHNEIQTNNIILQELILSFDNAVDFRVKQLLNAALTLTS
jgi:hypothetical protein